MPNLKELNISYNKGLSGELTAEFMMRATILDTKDSGGKILTPFFVGTSFPSEYIKDLIQLPQFKTTERVQQKVVREKVHDGPTPADVLQPRHRCLVEKAGSKGNEYYPWQRTWALGLDELGVAATANSTVHDVFIACWSQKSDLRDVFKTKFLNATGTPEEVKKMNQKNDFDPKYRLNGDEAFSILDWERRIISNAETNYLGWLRVKYITETGQEFGRPDWYRPCVNIDERKQLAG